MEKNSISDETQSFAIYLGINWDLNLPLAPWHGGGVLQTPSFSEALKYC